MSVPDLRTHARARTDFRRALLAWYDADKRDLPWRRRTDPYSVWLSEILLQQTRVETATPYYERFIKAFPTVNDLAVAPIDRVLKLWEGLGYYTRARNLHRAASVVASDRGGRFPERAEDWAHLPGVGRYTAGAIASISSGEVVPAVDGNVKRVLARLLRIELPIDAPRAQDAFWSTAELLVARRRPGDFNQAMMELGARVCLPRRPVCLTCPVRRWCQAADAGVQDSLPQKGTKRTVPRVAVVAAIIRRGGKMLLVRRPNEGLLAGMWTFPHAIVDSAATASAAMTEWSRNHLGVEVRVGACFASVTHIFTHRRYEVDVCEGRFTRRWRCDLASIETAWARPDALGEFALPTIDQKILRVAIDGHRAAGR